MKKYIENLAKASFVMLAVVAAFAFTTPIDQPDYTGNYGRTVNGQWVEITNQMELGTDYVCTPAPSNHCIYLEIDGDPHPDFEESTSSFLVL